MRQRCANASRPEAECEDIAARTRELYAQNGLGGKMVVPGETAADWFDSGQCRDCFQPAFNYRPRNSVQYITALSNFGEGRALPLRLIASSDNHSRGPHGYKEYARSDMTEQRGAASPDQATCCGRARGAALEPRPFDRTVQAWACSASRRPSGRLLLADPRHVAVHAESRTRDGVWNALRRRDLRHERSAHPALVRSREPADGAGRLSMGSEVKQSEVPRFEVRAVGSCEQEPGCPDSAPAPHARAHRVPVARASATPGDRAG